MLLRGVEYDKRLREFSPHTIKIISDIAKLDKEIYLQGQDIVSNNDYTEQQVVEKLLELKNKHLKHT